MVYIHMVFGLCLLVLLLNHDDDPLLKSRLYEVQEQLYITNVKVGHRHMRTVVLKLSHKHREDEEYWQV